MKKLMIILALLLCGGGSIYAQDAWEVYVDWNYYSPYNCTSQLSSEYTIIVHLVITDVANSVTVTPPNTYHQIDWDDPTETTFNESETGVKTYCEDSHDNTPNFTVAATVAIVHISTQSIFCIESDSDTGVSCSEFYYDGVALEIAFY